MPKREPKKCRQWERERRNRLKTQFTGLSKVLPSYDPSAPLSKSDILKGATSYIKELQTIKQKIINGDQSLHDDLKRDLHMLDTRIEKLLNRNEQLVALLQNAGIRIPTELKAEKQFCKPKLWSNKITKEKADILAEQVNNAEKENEKDTKKVKLKKTKTKNNENKKIKINKKIKKSIKSQKTLKVLHYNNNVTSQNTSSQILNVTNYSTTVASSSTKNIVPYQSNSIQSQTSSIIINNPTITCKNAGVTNSTLLSTPIMATGITTDSRSIASLGPGTLILANGNVFPILPGPSPATIIQQPTLLVTNTAPASNQTLLVVGKSPQTNIIDVRKNENTTILKQYPRIAIKRPGITKTTTVNKVPIPALTSKFTGRKVIGKENQKKQTINSQKTTSNGQIKQLIKHKDTAIITTSKKCECSEKEIEIEPPEKVSKLIEKHTENEVCKESKNDAVPEKKVPVSNYSVDSLCAKTESTNDEKKIDNSPSKSDNNISSPDIPVTTITVQTSTSTLLETVSTGSKVQENLSLTVPTQNHSDFSNDLFSTLNIQNRHPESISPTAAFLLAFPLVSTLTGGKTENADEENSESQHDPDPPTLLQIGNIETKQQTESQISFENIPNFYTTTKSKKNSTTKLKGSSTNILDTINTLIPEIPSFQNHIFNYEHTPVTCNKTSKSLPISFTNSSTEVNYSDIPYSNSGTVFTSTIDLQITKTSTPYISKITNNTREQFKYPDLKIQKPLVNWMTSPSTTTMVENTTSFLPDFGTAKTKYFIDEPRNYTEEQYPWTSSSATTTGVNIAPPSTLPMLMGDLALSTTSTYSKDFIPNVKQSKDQKTSKQFSEHPSNNTFLSVSQLVDHGKSEYRGNKSSPPRKTQPASALKQQRSSKSSIGVKEVSFSELDQNWIKQTSSNKTPIKSEQKTYITSHVDPQYDTQNWIKQSIDSSKNLSKNVPEISYESQNWMKQPTDSKNLSKSNYNCSSTKESPFVVSHVSNTSTTYGTQNWIKQSTDKNPSKSENCSAANKESPFVSHVTNTIFPAQNWLKQSNDTSNHKTVSKIERKTVERYNVSDNPFETQNWVKQQSMDKSSAKSESKVVIGGYNNCGKEMTSFVTPEIPYDTQNWTKQSIDPSDHKRFNCGTNKESTFVPHISDTSFETQNWIRQSADTLSHKNPPKTELKPIERTNNKEPTFVSHMSDTSFETQNWIRQSADTLSHKNPPKTEQKPIERTNKEATFVSHMSDTSFETQNWVRQSADTLSHKNPPKTEQKPIERTNKEAIFVSHMTDTSFETQNWVRQSSDTLSHKNPPKTEQKPIERTNKEATFVSHMTDTSFETQNWVRQSSDTFNHKNPPKTEQKPIERYNCGNNKETTFVPQIPNASFENLNWIKQSTDSSNHKNPTKTEQKSIERYNCGNKVTTFVPHISDTSFDTQNWIKPNTESSNNKNVYKNQSKIEHKTVERYYNTQNDTTQNWIKNPMDSNKHVYKNCSSTYSAEALISGQSSTNYPYSTSKRGYVPTFDPIQPFYNNEYSTGQESTTNYYPQNYQNFQNYQEFDDNYNTPSLFPSNGGVSSNQIKACSKVKDNRKPTGNISISCSNTKRANKRKQNLIEPPPPPPASSSTGIGTTTLPGFSDLGFLSISSTNSPALLPTDDPFHVPNLFNSTNNTNSSQIYSQNYTKNQHTDHLMASTFTSTCNLLPPLTATTSVSLAVTRNPTSVSTAGINVPSSVGGNSLANFNLSTIFPEINKPVTSSGVYENSSYHQQRTPINNNLPNLIPQQNCGNYTNLQ